MENVIPTETMKKEPFKVIPVLAATRERLKNKMMKVDTYDSYINKQLDKLEAFEKRFSEQ
jgi:hypothetical protein